jgi:aspartate carbamoyltransferase catalytic subunit/aspartate carbamoyltransferase regulatory subunit
MENDIVRDVTCVNDLNNNYINKIVPMANDIYRELRIGIPQRFTNYLSGSKCVLIFSDKSTRTYDSFNGSFQALGASNIVGIRKADESSLKKGESLFHTIDTYIGQGTGADLIITRHEREGAAKWAMISAFRSFAKKIREFASVYHCYPHNLKLPIILSGGDGQYNHPSQALLDCSTIYHYKKKNIFGLKLGISNDISASRVASSLINLAKILDWEMHFAPLPGTDLNERQIFWLAQGVNYRCYKSLQEMLPNIDFLYVNRYQFNQRGETTGVHAEKIFSTDHPRVSLDLVWPFSIRVMHARPIDKFAQEITPDLYDHSLDISGVQSDFGDPTRMAMCIYAIENQLFSLGGIIKTLNPKKMGFKRVDLGEKPSKKIKSGQYTKPYLDNAFVIDHIQSGCGEVISAQIRKLFPDIQIVLSLNIRGEKSNSAPKDVIKLHVGNSFHWSRELDNIVALFTDYTVEKSCRVSRFLNGSRIKKWAFRMPMEEKSQCINKRCITSPDLKEGIKFSFEEKRINGKTIKVCPFCEWPQEPFE